QLQTMVMYAYTGIMKLTGSTWQRGTAIYYALSDGSFARFPELFDRVLATMSVGIFSWASVWGYLAWVEPRRLGDFVARLSGRARDGSDVVHSVPVGDDPGRGSVAVRAR